MFEPGLEVSLEKNSDTFHTALRGWKPRQYMLVDLPEGVWAEDREKPVIGRLFGRGTYYGFTSYVIGILREVRLLMLSYPDEFVDTVYRKSLRFNVSLPAILTIEEVGETRKADCVITNISEGGLRLLCRAPFSKWSAVKISMQLLPGTEVEGLPCAIKLINETGGMFDCAAEFEPAEESQLEPLRKYVNHLSAFIPPES